MPRKADPFKRPFGNQRKQAKLRGIPFLLTLEEWKDIWLRSGHWHERGRRKNQYVMSRPGDTGPYAVWNVRITTGRENIQERRNGNAKLTDDEVRLIRKKYGKVPYEVIAKQHGVSVSRIHAILVGKAWNRVK